MKYPSKTTKFGVAPLLLFACTAVFASPQDAVTAANGPQCQSQRPFYWEIGNSAAVLASGSVGGNKYGPSRTTAYSIASASKWVYAAYLEQIKGGAMTATDVKFMTFNSGYTTFTGCASTDTVASCAATAVYNKRTDGYFTYGGGHMQVHAAAGPLAASNSAALAATVNTTLGTSFSYSSPQLAGGITTSAATYASFLRKVMSNNLVIGAHLLDYKVCTDPATCSTARVSPVPEPWFYGIGHWIETDGTFSSPGAFGFYPWISADRSLYGIVSRMVNDGGYPSVTCGRAIRQAFLQ